MLPSRQLGHKNWPVDFRKRISTRSKSNPCSGLGFTQHQPRLARFRIDEIQVHLVLGPVQNLRPDHAFAHPAEPWDVRVLVAGQRNPAHFALVCVDHAQLHHRIRIAHLGILLVVHTGMRRHPVGDGIDGHLALIHVEKHDLFAVGRPEIIAAHAQLFRVDPVDVAIEQIVAGIFRELLLVLAAHRTNIQIVLAHIGQMRAVGRKLRISAGIGRRRKLHRRSPFPGRRATAVPANRKSGASSPEPTNTRPRDSASAAPSRARSSLCSHPDRATPAFPR